MTKHVLRRILETFFKRWWLYLLPLLVFTALGVNQALGASNGYRSVGVISVSGETLLSELTQIRGDAFGFESPATVTSRRINNLLGTEQFITSVAERAGIGPALEQGELTALELRDSVSASPTGDALVQVVAQTEIPELSVRLAQATIESYRNYVVDGEVAESRAAQEFFESQLEEYSAQLATAQQELADYAARNPGPAAEERPLDQQVEIDRLRNAVDAADEQASAARQKSEEARQAIDQASKDIIQRLQILDEPQVPLAREPWLKQAAVTMALFGVVGLMLSVGAVALATATDRNFKSVEDLEQALDVAVIAMVPDAAA